MWYTILKMHESCTEGMLTNVSLCIFSLVAYAQLWQNISKVFQVHHFITNSWFIYVNLEFPSVGPSVDLCSRKTSYQSKKKKKKNERNKLCIWASNLSSNE